MTFGSLFSGIDGFAEGLEKVGMELKWQVEINEFCQKILKQDWPDVPKYKDIREVGKYNLETVDLICGGFPCQPFSIAGKRRGKEDDRYLWPEMLRVIQEIKPSWVFAENVSGILHIDDGMVFESVLSSLEAEGYEVQPFIVPACAVDAPHRRDRVWIMAYTINNTNRPHRNKKKREDRIQEINREEVGGGMFSGTSKTRFEDVADPETIYAQRQHKKQGQGKSRGSRRWQAEPRLGRVANGVPNRKNRLEALGNAVVPQLVEMIGKSIIYSNNLVDQTRR